MVRWEKEKIMRFSLFLMAFCLSNALVFGQKERYINPGLLSASSTLSPAVMLNRGETNYYIMGFLEGRVHKNFAFRGETYYMLGNANTKFLKNNWRSFFGVQYGIPVGNFEAHAGFSPGFSIMKSNYNTSNTEFVPSVQLNIGVRYYVWKYFHFFCNFSYIHSRMNNLDRINGMTDELVFSAGLGFNFQTLKKYRQQKN